MTIFVWKDRKILAIAWDSLIQLLSVKLLKFQGGSVSLEEFKKKELPKGEIGEIVIAGTQVTNSYLNNPEAFQENKIKDGDKIWHRLGDVGYLDNKGYLWLVGRNHNIIQTRNKIFYPAETEAIFENIDNVNRTGLVGYQENGIIQVVVVLECSPEDNIDNCLSEAEHINQEKQVGIDKFFVKYQLPVDPRHNTKIDTKKLEYSVNWHNRMKREGNLISTTSLQNQDSYIKRLWAYLVERYEPVPNLIMLMMLVIAFLQAFRNQYEIALTPSLVLATVLLISMKWLFYLLIRIFDEHKD
ncbi:peptide synthase, partial [Candidatus Magnetomorum sp. HK-1]